VTQVVRVTTAEAMGQALAIRRKVFVEEQGVPAELEVAHESEATAFLAVVDGTPLGTGRFRPFGAKLKFERIATLPASRGLGIASALMAAMEAAAAAEHPHLLPYMHAQISAACFYLKLGWTVVGEPFTEAGIAHVEMVKAPAGR
jgi:predicted GNAT family N-acyltransferase